MSQAPELSKLRHNGGWTDLATRFAQKLVGQPRAVEVILPHLQTYRAGFSPEGRPAGAFLLLGPTGTGKTRTVQALAEVIHGSRKHFLKINCGEYQMEHEVAKLLGAPPGYQGHRETAPAISAKRLADLTSARCDLAIVLFDEIEKAASTLEKLLLGILDEGVLQLGDNSIVHFENSIIFFTSNIGAREMLREIQPHFGFQAPGSAGELRAKLEAIALTEAKRRFSPEFLNRLDAMIVYEPLSRKSLAEILELHLQELQGQVNARLGERGFGIDVTEPARAFLLDRGTSLERGARELGRVLHRHLTQPLSLLVTSGKIPAVAEVRVDVAANQDSLELRVVEGAFTPVPVSTGAKAPYVLIVDDNRDLLLFLEALMSDHGWRIDTAATAGEAANLATRGQTAAILDFMLPDDDGVGLALQLRERNPELRVIIMSGLPLPPEDELICLEHDFRILYKPFLPETVIELVENPPD